jgi:hypothetical protein
MEIRFGLEVWGWSWRGFGFGLFRDCDLWEGVVFWELFGLGYAINLR